MQTEIEESEPTAQEIRLALLMMFLHIHGGRFTFTADQVEDFFATTASAKRVMKMSKDDGSVEVWLEDCPHHGAAAGAQDLTNGREN